MDAPSPAPTSPRPEPSQPPIAAVIINRDTLQIIALSLLVCVLSYFMIQELKGILRPLFVALFICYLVIPVHGWLVRLRLPSRLAYVLILAIVIVIMYVLGSLLVSSALSLGHELPSHVDSLRSEVNRHVQNVQDSLHSMLSFHPKTSSTAPATHGMGTTRLTSAHVTTSPTTAPAGPDRTLDIISPEQVMTYSRSALEAMLGMFSSIAVIVIYLIFLVAEHSGLPDRLVYALGPGHAREVMSVTGTINSAISRYIAIKTLTSAIIGVLTVIVLVSFGVKYPLVWGLVGFLANFVPYVGSLVAVALPGAMSLIQFGSLWETLAIAAILFSIHEAVGWLVEPPLLGHGLDVSPLVVLLSLAFWGFVWGLPGMVISTPLAVAMKIVLENIPSTRPLARLCSSGPPGDLPSTDIGHSVKA